MFSEAEPVTQNAHKYHFDPCELRYLYNTLKNLAPSRPDKISKIFFLKAVKLSY